MQRKLITSIICLFSFLLQAATLPSATPETVAMHRAAFLRVDSAINACIEKRTIPGAVFAVLRHGQMLYEKAYGNKTVFPTHEPMDVNTVFDLASCTKPMATAISILILNERGLLNLNDPVQKYIPAFQSGKNAITIMHLLTHTSGLPVYVSEIALKKRYGAPNPDGFMHYIDSCRRDADPGQRMEYSCLNYITLQHIVENISGKNLRDFAKENIFDPLGMTHTDFCPTGETLQRCAPTSKLRGDSVLRGIVHDPLARVMNGGISGNAGLFSDVNDVAVLVAALQHGGSWNGNRILSEASVKTLITVPDSLKAFGRTPGWDMASKFASCKGTMLSAHTYCHTGYTGTSIVVDPDNDIAIILLTNRVHPYDKGSVVKLRTQIADIIGQAIAIE